MIKHYINLTNGIEAITQYNLKDYSFIRIQSTACEQHLWNKIILDLDNDFLMNVALGNECIIYDYGANKPVPRAIYQGVEFIKFALIKAWFCITPNRVYISKGIKTRNGSMDVSKYFDSAYNLLSKEALKKIKYFRTFINPVLYETQSLNIGCVTSSTIHDGNKTYYTYLLNH